MRTMVLAAGLGKRLRPLTDLLPKPVVPVLNEPLCRRVLAHLRAAGASHAVLNTHHLAERVEDELARAPRIEGLELLFVREDRLLGTGGGVKHALAAQSRALGRPLGSDEPIVVHNGDVLFAPDLTGAIAMHRAHDAIATMILRPDPDVARYGAVEIDGTGRVRRLLGEPARVEGPLWAFMFTGVHVLSARAVEDLPDEGCIVRRGYRRWIDRGEVVAGFVDASSWRDLGTPREYLAANLELARARPERAIAPGAHIDPSATLHECVVADGARLGPGVQLRRCVVWGGTHVTRSASDCVLAGEIRVHAGYSDG